MGPTYKPNPDQKNKPLTPSDNLFNMHLKMHKEMMENEIQSDVLGSYTGYSLIDDEPEQDADDL